MRLEELFFKPLLEDIKGPDQIISAPTGKRVVKMSLADVFMMMGKEIPRVKGPGKDNYIIPAHMLEEKEYQVGDPNKGYLDPKMAAAHANWVNADKIPGAMFDPNTGEIKPWKSNSYLLDLGLATAAGGTEFLDSLARGTAAAGDDVLWFSTFGMYDGDVLSDAVDGETYIDPNTMKAEEQASPLQAATNWIESFQSEEFKNEVELTANAVTSWEDALAFATGNSDASIVGVLGIMAGEMIPEVVDVAVIAGTAWWSGGTVSTAISAGINITEAGGAAAREIRGQVNDAYNNGVLQTQWQWTELHLPAAKAQLIADGYEATDPEFEAAAHKLALDSTVYSAYSHGLYATAAAGGVIDTIGDKLMYGGPIRQKFMGNAIAKTILAPSSEAVGEAVEQWMTNVNVINKAGKITTPEAGVLNAAYNGLIAGNTSSVVAGTVGTGKAVLDSPRRTKLAFNKLKRFYGGGRTDYQELVDIARLDPLTLETYVRDEDGRLRIDQLIKDDGLKSLEDIKDEKTLQRILDGKLSRKETRDGILIDGKRYKLQELQQGQRQLDLVRFLQNGQIDKTENMHVSTFETEEDVRELAELLGIKTGNIRKMPINQVMSELENIGRLDIRIAGRSNLEAPTWSDLNDVQKLEFVNTGKIEFINDADRGNQVWTREQVLRSSRTNKDTSVPEQIANLADNTTARPEIGVESYTATTERGREQDANTIEDFREQVKAQLETDLGRAPTDEEVDAQFTEIESDQNASGRALVVSSDMRSKIGNIASNRYELAQQRMNGRDKVLADAQAKWDKEFGGTHNPKTGVATVNPRYLDAKIAKAQDQVAIDNQAQAEEAMGPRFFPKPDGKAPDITFDINDLPEPGEINDSETKQMVVNNTKLTVSQGNLTADELAGKMNKLEKTYPGITNDVLGENGLENYKQNSQTEKTRIENEYKKLPPPEQINDVKINVGDAPAPVEVSTTAPTYNEGDTVTYTNTKGETRDAKVVQTLSNGNIQVTLNGATYALTPQQLVTPEVDKTKPEIDQTNNKVNVQTELPNLTQGDTVTYNNQKGQTRNAEVLQVLPNGNVQVTLNGATFALEPTQLTTDAQSGDLPNLDKTTEKPPANTDASLKRAQDELTPDLTPTDTGPETKPVTPGSVGPGNVPTPQGDPISGATPPDPDEIRKIAQNRADKIKADAQAEFEKRQKEAQAKLDKAKADADAKARIDRETTPDLRPDGPNMSKPEVEVLPPNVTSKTKDITQTTNTNQVPVVPSTVAGDPRNELGPNDITITPNTDASLKTAQDELTPDLTPGGTNADQTTKDKDDKKGAETDSEKDVDTKQTITPATDPQSEPGRPGGMNQNQQPPSSEITTTNQQDVTPPVTPTPLTKKIDIDSTTKNIATKVTDPKKNALPKPGFNILGLGSGQAGKADLLGINTVQFKDPLNLAKWKKFG